MDADIITELKCLIERMRKNDVSVLLDTSFIKRCADLLIYKELISLSYVRYKVTRLPSIAKIRTLVLWDDKRAFDTIPVFNDNTISRLPSTEVSTERIRLEELDYQIVYDSGLVGPVTAVTIDLLGYLERERRY